MAGRKKNSDAEVLDLKCKNCKGDVYPKERCLKCAGCKNTYHNDCIQVDRTTYEKVKNAPNWTCSKKCKSSIDRQAEKEMLPDNPTNRELLIAIREIQASQSFLGNKHDELSEKIGDVLTRFEKLEQRVVRLEEENALLKSKIGRQVTQNINSKQKELTTNIIVSGIPNSVADIVEAFDKLAAQVDVNFDRGEKVVKVERLFEQPKMANDDNGGNRKAIDKIPLLVQFNTEDDKTKFLKAAKLNKYSYLAAECGIATQDADARIFVKDHLSSFNFKLLKEARKLKEAGKAQFVWFQNSSVLVRKEENSKIFKIKSQEDILQFNNM